MKIKVKIDPRKISSLKKPNGKQWIFIGFYLRRWMTDPKFNHIETAKLHGIPEDKVGKAPDISQFKPYTQAETAIIFKVSQRRLRQYLSLTKPVWTKECLMYVINHPDVFSFTQIDKITRRSWKNRRSLANELSRHINGNTQRKRYERKPEKLDPNLSNALDQLRWKYGTRISITDRTIEFHHSGFKGQESRLIEELLK